MNNFEERRRLRQEKRDKKQAGNQRVRRLYRQTFAKNPEENADTEIGYGRYATKPLNGIDRPAPAPPPEE